MSRIWIQGAGELASGVAWRLHRCGYQVVTAELPAPLAVRRLVCFSEAVFSGRCVVEGVQGILETDGGELYSPDHVSVLIDPEARHLARSGAEAVVDARLTKRVPRPLPCGPAPLIGLGPGFVCGETADMIIETHREARLGEVIHQGAAAANTGIPGTVAGHHADRVVRAPAAGQLEPVARIGDLVAEGQLLGKVAGQPVLSPLSGRVRGLVHPAAELSAGEKVGDIDPRGASVDPARITDKALAVAGGVLEALLCRRILP
jgi:xanthine dehydrogenase accessory factor